MSTQDEIVTYLQLHPYACADELGTILGKTRANIQHHLKTLEQANIVSKVPITQSQPVRGRPRAYFSLVPIKRPNNLVSLADALLHNLVKNGNDNPKPQLLEQIARQILETGKPASTLTQRLNRTVKELSNKGYQARWEAHANGPQVVFRNCPYHPLPDQYPELCQMDAIILRQNLLVFEVALIAQIHIPTIPACRFILKLKQKSTV